MRIVVRTILSCALLMASIITTTGSSEAITCPPGTVARTVSGGKTLVMTYTQVCVPVKKDQEKSSKTPGGTGGKDGGVDDLCLRSADATSQNAPPSATPTETVDLELFNCFSLIGTPTVNVSALARSLVVHLQLPDATPVFGPDPDGNEWKMLSVGYPVWLWTEGPRQKSATASAQGLTFRLSAMLQSTSFAMGDGATVTCRQMTKFSASAKSGSKSPTCGHVYTKPSLPGGRYTVTATANWQVTWSVAGFSGSFPTSYSDSSIIAIGELHALNR